MPSGSLSSVCMCEPMAKSDQPTTIKKYANRRLYNTGTSTYVTLEAVSMCETRDDSLAWHAFIESAVKAVAALCVSVPLPHEVLLSGRVARSPSVVRELHLRLSTIAPVRRLHGEIFDFGQMQRVSAEARRAGIGLHLDGARLFVSCAYSGRSPAEEAAPFDTVYVSLWKCFNAAGGAILAGPREKREDLRLVALK